VLVVDLTGQSAPEEAEAELGGAVALPLQQLDQGLPQAGWRRPATM